MKKVSIFPIISGLIIAFVICFIILARRDFYEDIYQDSVTLFESGDYDAGFKKLNEIPNFQNYNGVDELLKKYNICPCCGKELEEEFD